MSDTAISGRESPASDELADLVRRIAAAPHGTATEDEARLYRSLAPRVRLYGLKHLRDRQMADDLAQQVLVTTIERIRSGRVREPERITSFVLGTSRTMAVDLLRRERRRRELVEPYASGLSATTEALEPLDLDRLAECLSGLTERDRAVVTMTFYAERTAEEIAEELTMTESNVRVVRHRTLARLRRCMQGAGEGARS